MNGEKGRIRGELAIGRGTSRHTLVFGGSDADPNHDAVIRIGGEAPGRRAHSKPRRADHVQYRVAATSDRQFGSRCAEEPARAPNSAEEYARSGKHFQTAGRKTTPSSGSPVVTKRQSAMISLRASATIMVLRVPIRLSAVRARYHTASALSF